MKMARWVSAAAGAALLTAGFAMPASAAVADGNGNGGVLSVLSGNDVNAPVSAPVDLCGVALGLLGGANAGCQGGSSSTTVVGNGSGNGNGNAGVASIGSGNTVNTPISAPVNLCGVSAAVAGGANSGCKGGSNSTTVVGNGSGGSGNGNAGVLALGSGNTVNAPISAPVNVCGISLALLGFSNAGCLGGASSTTVVGNGGGNGGGNGNAGQVSLLSGNTVNAPISVPVNACGISLAVLGFANSGCEGGSTSVVVPPCQTDCHTPPPCQHNCVNPPPCQHNCSTTPPPCQHNCASTPPGGHTPPPGGNTPPSGGNMPSGNTPATTTGATTTSTTGTLPITGANLLGMVAAALASVGIGTALVIARRRRNG
jgi:hypothetical protein